MNSLRHPIFPVSVEGMVHSLSEEPILIDGMKLQFDKPVALMPVDVDIRKKRRGRTEAESVNR